MNGSVFADGPLAFAVGQVRSGDRTAMQHVYDNSIDVVWRYLTAAGVPDDRREVMTEAVYQRVLDRVADYTGRPSAGAWVVQQAQQVLLGHPPAAPAG